jgi:hypothetical protein
VVALVRLGSDYRFHNLADDLIRDKNPAFHTVMYRPHRNARAVGCRCHGWPRFAMSWKICSRGAVLNRCCMCPSVRGEGVFRVVGANKFSSFFSLGEVCWRHLSVLPVSSPRGPLDISKKAVRGSVPLNKASTTST